MSSQTPGAQPNKIVVTASDLETAAVSARVEQMKEAQKVALVREIGAPTTNSSGIGRAVLSMLAAGLIGGLFAWVAQRILFNSLHLFEDNTTMNNIAFTFILAFAIGVVVAIADPLFSGDMAKTGNILLKAIPLAIGFGLVLGVIANFIYSALLDSLSSKAYDLAITLNWTESDYYDYISAHLHLPRGIAWSLVGVAAGLTAGVPSGAGKRIALGAGGGFMGGFIGGFVFDYIKGEAVAQMTGILVLGALIGLAVALLEQAAKNRWIEIVAGGMAGKQFILYKSEITVGSSPSADITLIKDAAIAPIAVRIVVRGQQAVLQAVDPNCAVYVDGRLASQQNVKDSSRISIGNTEIRFRERVNQGKVPGAINR